MGGGVSKSSNFNSVNMPKVSIEQELILFVTEKELETFESLVISSFLNK